MKSGWGNVGPIYRSNVESSSKVDKRHQKCEKSYVAVECRVDSCVCSNDDKIPYLRTFSTAWKNK